MTEHELRLLPPDPNSVIVADNSWEREPIFSNPDIIFGFPSGSDRWDLLWQDSSSDMVRLAGGKPKPQSAYEQSLYLAKQFAAHAPRPVRIYAHRSAIASRIQKLRQLSSASGDPFNEASAELALNACEKLAAEIKPAIFLLPDGNLRALWRNEARESLGIQFLPDGDLQYVMLRRGRTKMLQTLGVEEDINDLASKVRSFGMERLWFHGKR